MKSVKLQALQCKGLTCTRQQYQLSTNNKQPRGKLQLFAWSYQRIVCVCARAHVRNCAESLAGAVVQNQQKTLPNQGNCFEHRYKGDQPFFSFSSVCCIDSCTCKRSEKLKKPQVCANGSSPLPQKTKSLKCLVSSPAFDSMTG